MAREPAFTAVSQSLQMPCYHCKSHTIHCKCHTIHCESHAISLVASTVLRAEHVLLLAHVIQKELKATPSLTFEHLPLYILFIFWVGHKETTVLQQKIMMYIKILFAFMTIWRTVAIVLATPLAVAPTSNQLLSPILQANDTINLGNNTLGSANLTFLNQSASMTALTLFPAMAHKSVKKSSTITFQEPISASMSTTTPSSSLTQSL